MAKLDNLNFSVIINDAKFDAKCAAIEQRAQQMNTTLAAAFQIESIKEGLASMASYKVLIEQMNGEIESLTKKNSDYGKKIAELQERINSGNNNEEQRRAMSEYNKMVREYISLLEKQRKMENSLNVRKVRDNNASLSENELKLLQRYTDKQRELRTEIDKVIARYPELKKGFNETYDTARLKQAVASEKELASATARTAQETKRLGEETGKVTKYVNQFKNILGGATSIYAMKRILSNLIEITGEFELQRTTLRAILQDANKADVIFEKIKGLALVSPFNFKELISYTKQLSAFSVPANELYDTTKMLADLSAGLGVGMDRLILAYGQVRSAAFLRGCLGKGTKIKTARGIVNVEDVVVGDVLYNEKNEEVNVMELIRGRENMFLVRQYKGMMYRVNENHILTCFKDGELHDVYVKDWNRSYYGAMVTENGLETYPITIERDGVDDYYGFVLDGNKRFQLGDGTVTHNTEVRQFTEAGVPLLEALRKEFEMLGEEGITVGQVFDKISNRQVSFEMVKKVLTDMTEEGGKFYNMQEVQSETLKGKLSNLKDAFQMMFNEIGESQSGVLKGSVDLARDMMKNWEQIGKEILIVVSAYGAYRTVASVAHIVSLIRSFNSLEEAIKKLTIAQKILNSTIVKNPYAQIALAIATLGYGIYKIVTAQNEYEKGLSRLQDSADKYNNEVNREVITMGSMIAELRTLTEGTDKYNKIKNNILSKYGEYLSDQQKEDINTKGLANSYDILTNAIRNAWKEKYKTQALTDIEDSRNDYRGRFVDNIKRYLKNEGLNTDLSAYILGLITDAISLDDIPDEKIRNIIKNLASNITQTMQTSTGTVIYQTTKGAAGSYLEEMKKAYLEEMGNFDKLVQETALIYDYTEPRKQKTEKELSEFYKRVQKTLEGFGKGGDYMWWADDTKNQEYYEYLDKIRERWKEIGERISDAGTTQTKNIPALKEEQRILESIAKALGVEINPQKSKSGGNTENPYKSEIDALKKQYDLIKQMQSAYEQLSKASVDDGTIGKFFKNVLNFSDFDFASAINKNLRFDGAIQGGLEFEQQTKLITDALRQMGDEGVKAADNIEQSVKKVDLSQRTREFLDLRNAVNKFNEEMKKWGLGDFNISGEGVGYKMMKELSEYNTKANEIEAKREKAATDLENVKSQLSDEEYREKSAQIDALYNKEMDYERKKYQERTRLLGKELAEEVVKSNPNIYTNGKYATFGTLKTSLQEIRNLIDEIDGYGALEMLQQKGLLSEEEVNNLKANNKELAKFIEAYKEWLKVREKDNENKLFKETVKIVNKTLSSAQKLSSALGNLGDAVDNEGLKEASSILGTMLTTTQDIVSAMESMYDNGSFKLNFSGVFGIFSSIFGAIFNGIASAIKKQKEMEKKWTQTMNEIRAEEAKTLHENNMTSGVSTIFGENYWKQIRNINSEMERLVALRKKDTESLKGELPFYGLYNNASKEELETMETMGWTVEQLEKYKKQLEAKEIDSSGLDVVIERAKEYEETVKELDEQISEIFGEMSSSMADTMIESFLATGDAITDAEKSLKSFGKTFLKTIIQSYLLDNVFNKYKEKLTAIFTSGASDLDKMKDIEELFKLMTKDLEDTGGVVNMLLETAKKYGWLDDDSSTDDSLKASIQGITEETASRIANMMNGMYAEMFRQGGILSAIYEVIVGSYARAAETEIPSSNNKVSEPFNGTQYLDYLQQIAANTYDTARHTDSILTRMDSIIASSGGTGGSGVKVYLQN